MNIQKSLQSSRFDRGSIKIAYCPKKNKMVPILNMDLTEEELESILKNNNFYSSNLYQRFKNASDKINMVKESMDNNEKIRNTDEDFPKLRKMFNNGL